jgi:hypothetical protein
MVDRTPIFIEVDGLDRPTGLAEFVSGVDVISQELGGTGATSVSGVVIGLGSSILTNELASGVSATAQESVGLAYNPTTGSVVPETAMTSIDITGKELVTTNLTVKATGFTVNGTQCPIPLPFAYIQLTADDAASSDEKKVGYSNTPTQVVSDTDDISWDDSAKQFIVKKAGTYECVGRLFFEGGSTLIELHINKEGSPVNTANPRAHTTVDPVERTISAIFTAAVDDTVDITYEATSAQTTAAQIGTTVTVKRLK